MFTFGDSELEEVDDYTYLGVTMNYNGHFKKKLYQNRYARQEEQCLVCWEK